MTIIDATKQSSSDSVTQFTCNSLTGSIRLAFLLAKWSLWPVKVKIPMIITILKDVTFFHRNWSEESLVDHTHQVQPWTLSPSREANGGQLYSFLFNPAEELNPQLALDWINWELWLPIVTYFFGKKRDLNGVEQLVIWTKTGTDSGWSLVYRLTRFSTDLYSAYINMSCRHVCMNLEQPDWQLSLPVQLWDHTRTRTVGGQDHCWHQVAADSLTTTRLHVDHHHHHHYHHRHQSEQREATHTWGGRSHWTLAVGWTAQRTWARRGMEKREREEKVRCRTQTETHIHTIQCRQQLASQLISRWSPC